MRIAEVLLFLSSIYSCRALCSGSGNVANSPKVCDNCESDSPFIFTVFGDNSSDTALVGVKPPYCVLSRCKTLYYYEVLVYSSVDNRTQRFEMSDNPAKMTQLLNISSSVMDKAFLKVRAFYDDDTSSRYSGCTYTFLRNSIQRKHADFITRQVQIEVDPCDMDTIHFFYTDRPQSNLGPQALHSSCLNQANITNESVTFFNISQTFWFVPFCEKVFNESDMDVIDFCKQTLTSDSDFLPFELNIVQVQYFRPRDVYKIVANTQSPTENSITPNRNSMSESCSFTFRTLFFIFFILLAL